MKITVKRTGGFAGLSEVLAEVDTATLDATTGKRIASMVREANFFALPSTLEGGEVGADMFQYALTIADGGRSHEVSFDTARTSDTTKLRNLVDLLVQSVG